MTQTKKQIDHPLDDLLRTDRIPHIWCPGCGIGTAFAACLTAMKASGIDLEKTVMVSGIGCTARGAGYVMLDSYHTTHGRAIPFATGLKLANPELNVVVFSGDGDLFAIGGQSFYPRRPPERGPHRRLREQPELRHDRRTGGRHHTAELQNHHHAGREPGRSL